MNPNEQKCQCHNFKTSENSNMMTSQTAQTSPIDSDVFYDFPDENDSSVPKSSNRSRTTTTQNDRNRDHTNLSHEPNIEAPAGPRQQPTGQRQTYQAKDNNDDDDANDNGNEQNKERSSLCNYFTPRGSCLCSNVSQDGFKNNFASSQAESSSIVKLSFSTESEGLQGSYECVCTEKDKDGSCKKFWCKRNKVLENKKKTRDFELSQKKLSEEENNENLKAQEACYCQKTVFDLKSKPDYECLCVRKSLLVSCVYEKHDTQQPEISSRSGSLPSTSYKSLAPTEQKSLAELCEQSTSGMFQKPNYSSKYLYKNSENHPSNVTEDLCPFEDFETSGESCPKGSKSQVCESSNAEKTATTPRQTLDENVIPLLKSIFGVLQTMREEQLHLGPIASKNIDIHLNEPFNGLPPPPAAPPSSTTYPKKLLRISCDSQSCNLKSSKHNLPLFEVEQNQELVNIEDNLSILEPPERDMEYYQETTPTSQRLIPVDMDLLRTDEELIWEPESNSIDKLNIKEEEERNSKTEPLKAQFRQFSEDQELAVRKNSIFQGESLNIKPRGSSFLEADMNAEVFARKSSNTLSSLDDQITTPALKKSSHQGLNSNPLNDNKQQELRTQASQATQVDLRSMENVSSRSAQFLTFDSHVEESLEENRPMTSKEALLHSKLKELSEEKLLKTSKESILPTVCSRINTTKVDCGTDCPNFDNVNRNSSNYYQEPNKSQNQEMSHFIESILLDLKAMDSARKNTSSWQTFARLPCPSTGGWQKPSKDLSFPATIETVQELGANSLFVKWRVQNIGNIGGYELFLDGHLTNRYFNCIHRAAVICDVNLHSPHRITLRAQPLLPPRTTSPNSSCLSTSNTIKTTTTTTHPEASCPQSDGSVWYPSVYHFEPNSLSAPINAVLY